MKKLLFIAVFVAMMAVAFVSQKMVMGQTTTSTPTTTMTPAPSVVVPSGAPSTGRGM